MKLLMPDIIFDKVMDITLEILMENDIKGLLIDIDDTLAKSEDPNPFEGVEEWISMLKSNGIKILLISNNKKERVKAFGTYLKLDYIYQGRKPFKENILKGCKKLNEDYKNIAIIGDQIFTDILGGRISKIKAFLVKSDPMFVEKKFIYIVKRKLERIIIQKYNKNIR